MKLPIFSTILQSYPDKDLTNHLGKIISVFAPAFLEEDKKILKSQFRSMLLQMDSMGVKNIVIEEYLNIQNLVQQYQGDPERLLRVLANNNKISEIKTLLKFYDVNLNCQSSTDQRTPLHWAASKGNSDVVTLLLEKGAKNTIADKDSKIPGDLAIGSCKNQLPTSDKVGHDLK